MKTAIWVHIISKTVETFPETFGYHKSISLKIEIPGLIIWIETGNTKMSFNAYCNFHKVHSEGVDRII